MNVVYFGFNALSSCLDLLIHSENIQVKAIYTGEENEHTDQIIQFAELNDIPCYSHKPSVNAMQELVDQGIECFICAEYPHKIPIPTDLSFSVNIHPTLLPEGRGQTPLPHLILNYPQHAGITLHKMTDELDAGDILLNKTLIIDVNETFDSLHTKIFLEAPMLLQSLLSNRDALFDKAKTQSSGSYWPTINSDQQLINWQMTHIEMTKVCQAFGSLGVKFDLNEKEYYFTSSQCVTFEHAYQAGDVITFDDYKLTIATAQGFIIIPRSCLFEI